MAKKLADLEKAGIKKKAIVKKWLKTMPAIDKYPSRQKWEAACWRRILKSRDLLQLLVTGYERRNLVMRAATLAGLASGKSYLEIGQELWLSPQTVSSIKKAITEEIYRSYRERSKSERKKKKYSSGSARPDPRLRGRGVRTKYGMVYPPKWTL